MFSLTKRMEVYGKFLKESTGSDVGFLLYLHVHMARVISVVNQKGGVGKTTTAINLATYLARQGKFVLLVDIDPQANATSGLGHVVRDLPHGTYHALAGVKPMSQVLVPTQIEHLTLAPGTIDLAGAQIELVNVENREFRLREALLEVRNNYDVVIIDNPPSLGLLTLNGLVAADDVLIPVQCEYYALEGLSQLLETVRLVQQGLQPNLRILGAVLTMYDSRARLSRAVLEELYKHFPNNIFRSVIPRNVRLAEAPSHGKPIADFEPHSSGARAYERLAREILFAI